MALVNQKRLSEFLAELDAMFARPAQVYLIGETSQVFEGWRPWTDRVELTVEVPFQNRADFERLIRQLAAGLEIAVLQESPAEVIPLPADYRQRARDAAPDPEIGRVWEVLQVYHFDPYSVAFRYIARGSEPDYHLVLHYLKHGWMTEEGMEHHLKGLLPRFTRETIQQDPAEFKRRYKGLLQMWRSVSPGTTHRHTQA